MYTGRDMADTVFRIPRKGEKIMITVEESSKGALVVCLDYCARLYRGVLIDCTNGVAPACVYRPKSAIQEVLPEIGTAIVSHFDETCSGGATATHTRFTYKPESEHPEASTSTSITAVYRRSHKNHYVRNRMLRPRQTTCSKCQSHVLGLNEDGSDASTDAVKKLKPVADELESAHKRLRSNASPVIKISFNSPNGQDVVEISSKTMVFNSGKSSEDEDVVPRKKKKSKEKHKHKKKNKKKHRRAAASATSPLPVLQQQPDSEESAGEMHDSACSHVLPEAAATSSAPLPASRSPCASKSAAEEINLLAQLDERYNRPHAENSSEQSDDGEGSRPALPDDGSHAEEEALEPLAMRVHTRNVYKYVHGDGRAIHVGDVVWGKISGFPWWPGRVTAITVSENDAGVVIAYIAHVAWFASKTSSNIACSDLYPFIEHFATRFNRKKKGPYKNAVKQAKLAVLSGSSRQSTAATGSFDDDESIQETATDVYGSSI